jgi:hypothetical protein
MYGNPQFLNNIDYEQYATFHRNRLSPLRKWAKLASPSGVEDAKLGWYAVGSVI